MTAKQWLSRARNIDREIEALERALEAARERATNITQKITGQIVQTTKDPHKYDQLAEYSDQLRCKINELIAVKAEIQGVIERVPNRKQRIVLTRYYLNGDTMERIAVDLDCSWRNVHYIRDNAFAEVEKILKLH